MPTRSQADCSDGSQFMSDEFVPGLVSVIIPTYNRADLVSETILSALNQTYPHVEIIVIDDGSTDETEQVVRGLIEKYGESRLHYVKQPNLGAPAARNHGLRLSRGEFIQFLDSDDLIHPEKLAKQVAFLRSHPDVDMTYCRSEVFRARPGDIGSGWWRNEREADIVKLIHGRCWPPNAPLWRRRSLLVVGPWRDDLACWQDWEFHVRALSLNVRVLGTPDVLNYVREHEGSRITKAPPSARKARSILSAVQAAYGHLVRSTCRHSAATEYLAYRASLAGFMFLESGDASGARSAFSWAISLKPSLLRRCYMALFLCLSYLPVGPAALRLAKTLCRPIGALARSLRLMPRCDR